MGAIPEELVQQFRTVALERLDRVEGAWSSVLSSLDDQAAVLVHRELHTLKGESKMLGFSDVNLVCHKLEDLLEVARARGYDVDEDFDLAVNMALRFMAMLVRKKVGAQLSGIDLPGFIRQIDGLLHDLKPHHAGSRTTSGMQPLTKAAPAGPRVPTALRTRLGPIAIDAFIEYGLARGTRRDRLRASWHSLRDLIGVHRAVVGPGQLSKHKSGAVSLARELGKQVDVVFELGSAEVSAEMLSAIDTAVLHLVRNAIDHGIETPAARVAAGKSERGTIRLQCGAQNDQFTLTVEDDGRGVSLEEVRARAIDVGLITPDDAHIAERWFEIVCQPGFSTRKEASDVSGRGVGLDVVRNGIADVGGTLTATMTWGNGTTWTISVPLPRITFEAHVFRAPNIPFPLVVDSSWQPLADHQLAAPIVDVAFVLGVTETRSVDGVRYFERDGRQVGVVTERPPALSTVRSLVVTQPPTTSEVVIIEATEGLLIHLDRMVRA